MSMQMILSRGMSKDEKELRVTLERRMGKPQAPAFIYLVVLGLSYSTWVLE